MNIERTFQYHKPTDDQQLRYLRLRSFAQAYAELIKSLTPESPEQTLALRAVHLASMHANSAIAINEPDADEEKRNAT